MPTYSYKEQFVPFVKEKSKRQTVRAYRKDGQLPVTGQFVNNFFGMRTKYCKRLNQPFIDTVTDVHTIFIFSNGNIYLTRLLPKEIAEDYLNYGEGTVKRIADSWELILTEKDLFAWKDGFRPEGSTIDNPAGSFNLMFEFWSKTHQLPFTGTVTYW